MDESRMDLAQQQQQQQQQQSNKKQKKITHFFPATTDTNNNITKGKPKLKLTVVPKATKPTKQKVHVTMQEDEEKNASTTTSTTGNNSNQWQTTGSPFIGQTCRRAIPPQFYHLIPKSISDVVNNVRLSDGIVMAWKESNGRTPNLYRIIFTSSSSVSSTTHHLSNSYYYEENVTTEELLSGIASANKRWNSSLTTEQFTKEQSKVTYYHKAIHRLHTHEIQRVSLQILPHLIIAAMQELTLEKCVESYITEEEAMVGTTSSSSDPSSFSAPIYGKYYRYTQIYKSLFRTTTNTSSMSTTTNAAAAAALVDFETSNTSATVTSSVSSVAQSSIGINNLTLSVSFVGSSIVNRIRQGAMLAQDVMRKGGGSLDWINILEQGGRVASCIVQFCSSDNASEELKGIDTYQLADAIKNVTVKQIQSAVLEHLLYRPLSSSSRRAQTKKKQEDMDEQDEEEVVKAPEQQQQPQTNETSIFHTPYRLICLSGDLENDFSRARYSLLSIQKQQSKEEKETTTKTEVDDDQDLQEKRKVTEALLKQQQQVQQRIQKRITELHSSDGFTKGIWSKWSDVAITCIQEKVSSVKAAFEQYHTKVEQEPHSKEAVEGAVTSISTSESQSAMVTDGSHRDGEDEAMAKWIAAEQSQLESSTTQRPRRTRAKVEGLFYGSASGLTQSQLRDSLHRIIVQCCPSFLTFSEVKRILLNENESIGSTSRDMKKVYSALLKLLFDLGKVARFYVTNEAEYNIAYFPQRLALNKPLSLPINGIDRNSTTDDQALPSENEESTEASLSMFEAYLQGLLQTERALRTLVLLSLQCTPKSVAGAADEDAESQRNVDESVEKEEDENDTRHPWIGQCVLRPDGSKWCVVSFTPSKLLDAEEGGGTMASLTTMSKDQANTALPSNRIVKRRCKFQLVPWVGDFESGQSSPNKGEESRRITLTEAQVNAGMDAVHLTMSLRRMRNFAIGNVNLQNRHSIKKKLNSMLTFIVEEQDSHEFCKGRETSILGKIVGFQGTESQPYYLFLPQADDLHLKTHDRIVKEPETTSIDIAATNKDFDSLLTTFTRNPIHTAVAESIEHSCDEVPRPSAQDQGFWMTLLDDETSVELHPADIKLDASSREVIKARIISWLDYSNPSMVTCHSILSWLKSQSKISPFLERVDADLLGLDDYYEIVKRPMDLGTVEANLMQGRYSDASGNVSMELEDQNGGHRPTFRSDLFLIFDNAILYNAPDSWIHKNAVWLKKNLMKRFDVEVSKLEYSLESSKTAPSAQYEYYHDEGREDLVDDDDYVYSEDDDSSSGAMTSSRRRKAKKSMDAGSAVTMDVFEKPSSISEILSSTLFSSYVDNDASSFSLTKDWLCRRLPIGQSSLSNKSKKTESKTNDATRALAHTLHQLMQTPSIPSQRRSTRAATALSSAAHTTSNDDKNIAEGAIEFYLSSEPSVCGSNRTHVEMIREAIHENYAEMYSAYVKHSEIVSIKSSSTSNVEEGSAVTSKSNADAIKPNKFYNKGIFPPFLGSISPLTGKWEIRSHLVLPALLWVVRGMIHSGYLGCDDGTTANNLTSFTPLTLSNAYYWNKSSIIPFDIEEAVKKQQSKVVESESEEEEVELSEYEKARLERVARNQERLRQLGLA